jgi:MATE family multidrug resistance protein
VPTHEATEPAPPPRDGVLAAFGELLQLALPLSLGFAGSSMLGFVDTAIVGRLGSLALGAMAIGNVLFFALSLVGMGFVSGAEPLVAQAFGAGDRVGARAAYWQALRLALYATVPLLVLLAAVASMLELFGIDAETASTARTFLVGRALNLPCFLVFAAARSYLQAASAARAIVVSMIVANVINFALDGLFVFGDRALVAIGLPAVGAPALGVLGSGIASTIASAASMLVVLDAVRRVKVDDPRAARPRDPVLMARAARLGVPVAVQLLAEVGAFTLATLFCGRMGRLTVAAHHVALSLASLTFTVALGVGSATTVLVGRAVGRGDTAAARRAGFLGAATGCGFMGLCAMVFFTAPAACARVLTDDASIVAAAAPLVVIAGFFQLSDGAQCVFGAALRGAGDTRFSQNANLVGHYLIGVPIAVWLGFFTPLGARGVWWGLSAGLTSVGLLLALRFDRLSRRRIARA